MLRGTPSGTGLVRAAVRLERAGQWEVGDAPVRPQEESGGAGAGKREPLPLGGGAERGEMRLAGWGGGGRPCLRGCAGPKMAAGGGRGVGPAPHGHLRGRCDTASPAGLLSPHPNTRPQRSLGPPGNDVNTQHSHGYGTNTRTALNNSARGIKYLK